MSSSFVEVEIKADADLVENLIGILSQLGFEGFWEDGPTLKCYITSARWTQSMQTETETTIRRMIRSSASTQPEILFRTIANRNWNEEWEKTIQPIQITDRIVITPTWHEYTPGAGQIVLTIDPKMSFGTGYHETTRLVLKLMEKYVKRGIHILDVGTGTGVLAIAGIKLGARSAVGIDIDEWSSTNAEENVRLNGVEQSVTIHQMELRALPVMTFDMIVANIQLNVLLPLLPEMKMRLHPHGLMILSGLLLGDKDEMLAGLSANGMALREELCDNEWIALVAGKDDESREGVRHDARLDTSRAFCITEGSHKEVRVCSSMGRAESPVPPCTMPFSFLLFSTCITVVGVCTGWPTTDLLRYRSAFSSRVRRYSLPERRDNIRRARVRRSVSWVTAETSRDVTTLSNTAGS